MHKYTVMNFSFMHLVAHQNHLVQFFLFFLFFLFLLSDQEDQEGIYKFLLAVSLLYHEICFGLW